MNIKITWTNKPTSLQLRTAVFGFRKTRSLLNGYAHKTQRCSKIIHRVPLARMVTVSTVPCPWHCTEQNSTIGISELKQHWKWSPTPLYTPVTIRHLLATDSPYWLQNTVSFCAILFLMDPTRKWFTSSPWVQLCHFLSSRTAVLTHPLCILTPCLWTSRHTNSHSSQALLQSCGLQQLQFTPSQTILSF